MSTDYNCYIGPYIKVFAPPVETTEERYTCVSNTCRNFKIHLSSNYCDQCGRQVCLYPFPITKRINFNIYKKFNETLYDMCDDGNNIIVVDSTSRDMPSGVYVDVKYGPNIIPVDATVITKSIDDTNSIFEKQIATLKEVFGDNNVTVEWGVVTYTT